MARVTYQSRGLRVLRSDIFEDAGNAYAVFSSDGDRLTRRFRFAGALRRLPASGREVCAEEAVPADWNARVEFNELACEDRAKRGFILPRCWAAHDNADW